MRYDFLLFIGRGVVQLFTRLVSTQHLEPLPYLTQYFRCLFNFSAHSEPNTAGRSCSTLNRIVLAAKEIRPMSNHKRGKLTISRAGLPGFEPGNAGVKVLCLTAWR